MIQAIRNKKRYKVLAILVIASFVEQVLLPIQVYGITNTGGELQVSHGMGNGGDLVNLYTGDFNYNIPVLNVPGPHGGYPINLSYSSAGVTMEADASWVGLGWTLNPGAVNRMVNVIPDDFKEDEVKYDFHRTPYKHYQLSLDPKSEQEILAQVNPLYSGNGLTNKFQNVGLGLYYNNYYGFGARFSYNLSAPGVDALSVNLSYDTQQGIGYSPSVNIFGFQASVGVSGRDGVNNVGMSISGSNSIYSVFANGQANYFGFNVPLNVGIPLTEIPTNTKTNIISTQLGLSALGGFTAFPFFEAKGPIGWVDFDFSTISTPEQTIVKPAYGVLYDEHGSDSKEQVRDFQHNHKQYTKGSDRLSASSKGSDHFVYSAAGAGGSFEAFKSQVEIAPQTTVSAPLVEGLTTADIGVDATLQFAGGHHKIRGGSYSGKIRSKYYDESVFTGNSDDRVESVYFRKLSDRTIESENGELYNVWGEDAPVYAKITKSGNKLKNQYIPKFEGDFSEGIHLNNTATKGLTKRKNRQTVIQYLNQGQAAEIGFSRKGDYYTSTPTQTIESRSHHIGEINIWEPGGTRYTYGYPVYVKEKTQLSFSANGQTQSVSERTGVRHPVGGQRYYEGGFELQNQTTLPEHATSWMISSVTSNNYVDLSGDGPTQDDQGYWVKFGYKQTTDPQTGSFYNFRTPREDATFTPANKGVVHDDMGMVSFGQRENVYVETIETKTHIAKFFTSHRKDGKESYLGDLITGDQPTDYTHKLDKIELYLKDPSDPTKTKGDPLKTVNFVYDYELCVGVPENDGTTDAENPVNQDGKLTLKEIYYTFGKSAKGEADERRFKLHYAPESPNENHNPIYQPENVDRWGHFRKVLKEDKTTLIDGSNYPSIDFPYSDQEQKGSGSVEDIAPAPWCLKRIEAPGGAVSEIQYEYKEYAYVEDQYATEMIDIVGFKNDELSSGQRNVSSFDERKFNGTNKVYFKLSEQSTEALGIDPNQTDQARDFINSHYLRGINKVYIKAFVKLTGTIDLYGDEGDYDYVESYAGVNKANSGILYQNNTYYGFVELIDRPVRNISGANALHPLRKAAFERLKTHRGDLAYNQVLFQNLGAGKGAAKQMANIINGVVDALHGQTLRFLGNHNAKKCRLNGWSKIRLTCSDKSKRGGGARVKSVTVRDNWKNRTLIDQNIHRTVYDYTTVEDGERVSSGVAYEPMAGFEENANFYMRYFTESNELGEDNEHFNWEPTLLSYYPAPSVGYGEVTVRQEYVDYQGQVISLQKASAPYEVHRYYTPKDFPVVCNQTIVHQKAPAVYTLSVQGYKDVLRVDKARSQGYSVQTNDMAGKTKELLEMSNDNKIIARQIYTYHTQTKTQNSPLTSLIGQASKKSQIPKNEVQVLNKDNQYENHFIGRDLEVVIDGYENQTEKESTGSLPEFNVMIVPYPPFVIPAPSFYLDTDIELTEKELVVIKKIHRQGLLKEIKTQKNKSIITTHILAYEAETGSPILTSVDNEFEDQIYKLVRPAHYETPYSSSVGSYRNMLMIVPSMILSKEGHIPYYQMPSGQVEDYFQEGDLLKYSVDGEVKTAHVLKIDNNKIRLIDWQGYTVNADEIVQIKVIESGYSNQLGLVVGETSFMDLSINNNTLTMGKILNSSAVTFKDTWAPFCCLNELSSSEGFNPYQVREKGIWRPWKSYIYHGERDYSSSIDSRNNGVFKGAYVPFNWTGVNTLPWVESSEVTLYAPGGGALEQKDGLGIYSASILGYGNMVTATASRAQNREIGFDSFEDLEYTECTDQQFRFEDTSKTNSRIKRKGHTGDYFRVIQPGSSIELTKELDCE